MFFDSKLYLLFFTVVFAAYWSLPWHKARIYLLLAASFVFYASWSSELAFLVAGTSCADYLFARAMDASKTQRRRKWLLGGSLTMNLGLLAFFKYRNFFLEPLEAALRHAGVETGMTTLKILVPFGISFYTFEAVSYAVDVYRRRIPAEKSLPHFMLFILFFPHLVAGPIVRGKDFLRQTWRPKRFDWMRMQLGVQVFLVGLFKKMVIADAMAVYSDPVFSDRHDPAGLSTASVWLGVLAFAIRIYCDFSGYSDMALGSAHMLGYKLTKNFAMPYLSPNVTDFWRRWHISLSSWLRDYLFIPLGGSRGGKWQTCRNLMITMTLGGLWHGANWSFVLWGVAHGLLLIGHKLFREATDGMAGLRRFAESSGGTLLRIGITFFCVMMCWVLFQPSLERSMLIYGKLFAWDAGSRLPMTSLRLWISAALLVGCQAILLRGLWNRYAHRIPAPAMGLGYAATLILALLLAPDTGRQFIYFDF